MLRRVGQIVPRVKDYVYRDIMEQYCIFGMMKKDKSTPATRYRKAFCQRLKAAREAAGYTQITFAKELGLERDTYAKYESRSLLPHHLIPRVCQLTGHDAWYMLTGQSPTQAPVSQSQAGQPG